MQDLVNDRDEVIGTVWRSKVFRQGLVHTRHVNAFVVNGRGEVWIPRRTTSKARWPGALDMSVGGAVAAGEEYENAFRREANEELNLDVDAMGWREIGRFSPLTTGLSSFQRVYELRSDAVPAFNRDDFEGGEWRTPADLVRRIESGDAAKPDLRILLRLCYGL